MPPHLLFRPHRHGQGATVHLQRCPTDPEKTDLSDPVAAMTIHGERSALSFIAAFQQPDVSLSRCSALLKYRRPTNRQPATQPPIITSFYRAHYFSFSSSVNSRRIVAENDNPFLCCLCDCRKAREQCSAFAAVRPPACEKNLSDLSRNYFPRRINL